MTVVHGDDYFSREPRDSLLWLKGALEKKYELKSQIIRVEKS